jgi:stage V sporulation protein AC
MSNQARVKLSEVVRETDKKKKSEYYNQYVNQITPKYSIFKGMMKAFLIGGIICTIGQFIMNSYISLGVDKESAKIYNTITLIFLSVLLTGIGFYQKLAKFGGAGTLVPITGFANSVAAPAVEYKKEGQVFGIGCKIFTIAGPVILYGIFTSWVLGIIHYLIIRF